MSAFPLIVGGYNMQQLCVWKVQCTINQVFLIVRIEKCAR